MTLSGKPAYAFQLDIADPESVENVIASIREKVGKVDILVNNAGFGIFQEFTEMKPETIRNMFEVNVLGMMVLTQQIALEMVDQRSGHIINVASMAGKIATPKICSVFGNQICCIRFFKCVAFGVETFRHSCDNCQSGAYRNSLL